MRGSSQLRGELKNKARTAILAHYITPCGNSKTLRKERIKWLLENGVFTYGDMDIEVSINIHKNIYLTNNIII